MRFINFRPRPSGPEIPLHPRITAILGMSPVERLELVATVHGVATGEQPEWSGMVEVDGTTMTLREAVDAVGPTSDAALIVTPVEIPNEAGPDSRVDPSESEPGHVQEIRHQLSDAANELGSVETLCSQIQSRVELAQVEVDLHAICRLDRLDGDLRRAADLAGLENPWVGLEETDGRIEQLLAIIDDAEHRLTCLPSGDRGATMFAVAIVNSASGDGKPPHPQAARILEEWTVLEERRTAAESRLVSLGLDVSLAAERVRSAEEKLLVAAERVTPREISAEELAAVERAQELYLSNHDKALSGIRRGTARRRMQEARDEVTAVLEPLGYPTWSSFRMGDGMVQVTEESVIAHETACAELEAAQIELGRLVMWSRGDTELAAIDRAKAEIHAAALELGVDPTPGEYEDEDSSMHRAMSEVEPDSWFTSVDVATATADLRAVLDRSGSYGQGKLRSEWGVVALGESWLSVLRDADRARLRLVRDLERAAEEVEVLRRNAGASPGDRLAAERAAVRDAEEDASATTRALFDVAVARTELHLLVATHSSCAEEHQTKVDLLAYAEGSMRRAGGFPHTELAYPGLAERIPRGAGGAIPLVVLIGGVDAKRLDPLLALPPDAQVLVVGDGDQVVDWVRSVGAHSAGVVDLSVSV